MTIRKENGNEMKNVMNTKMAVGYSFDEVVEREVDGYQFWKAVNFEELSGTDFFEDGRYYYFSNYYGSNGGYYNPEDGATFYTSYELDDMDDDMVEVIQNNWNFIDEPCIKEVHNLRAGFESERECQLYGEKRIIGHGEEVIRDEDGHVYRCGVYQFIGDKFYPVELTEKDGITADKKQVIENIKNYGKEVEEDIYKLEYFGKEVILNKRTITVDGIKLPQNFSVKVYPNGSAELMEEKIYA